VRKRYVVLLALLSVVFILSACDGGNTGSALDDPDIPHFDTDTGYVIDVTDQLSDEYERQLEAMLESLDDQGWQTVIGVFSNLASEPVLFGTEVMNENGIGDSSRNDGLVIVIFVDKEGGDGNEPAIGVAVGSGLEGDFNDARVGRMLDATYVPLRADGDWEEGLVSFVTAYEGLRGGTTTWEQYPEKEPMDPMLILLIVIVVVVLVLIDGGLTGFQLTLLLLSIGASSIGGGGGGRGGGASR
jgi:uncharacterized protein